MKLTNQYDLPLVIKRALEKDLYEGPHPGVWPKLISTTTLINPPQIAFLKMMNYENITRDVSTMVWALIGTAVHSILERGKSSSGVSELRLEAACDRSVISTQFDYYEDGTLWDWKTTSVKAHGKDKPEWENQLNVEAWVLRKHNMDVERIKNIVFYRDFFESKKEGRAKSAIIEVEQKLWSPEQQQAYVEERVQLHWDFANAGGEGCTDSETWGGRRCESYCDVAPFCQQFAGTKK